MSRIVLSLDWLRVRFDPWQCLPGEKVLSVRVFAGVASVRVRRLAAVVLWLLHSAPLLLEQRVRTSPRSTGFCAIWDCISSSSSPACGPPFFLPCAPISCVRSARQMCAQKQAFANWLNGDIFFYNGGAADAAGGTQVHPHSVCWHCLCSPPSSGKFIVPDNTQHRPLHQHQLPN